MSKRMRSRRGRQGDPPPEEVYRWTPIVITTDGYVLWDPVDGYTVMRGELAGALRRIVDGVMVEVPPESWALYAAEEE